MKEQLRVAFFADSYVEVNGAAMTSQRLTGYAKKNNFPFLCIHAAKKGGTRQDGSVMMTHGVFGPAAGGW